jgi:hypothetical protein
MRKTDTRTLKDTGVEGGRILKSSRSLRSLRSLRSSRSSRSSRSLRS